MGTTKARETLIAILVLGLCETRDCLPPVRVSHKSSNVTTACPDSGGVDLTATSTTNIGCIQRKDVPQDDGYVATIAQPASGSVVLGFRQGEGNTNGGVTNITGYYFQIDPAGKTYQIFKVDGNGTVANLMPTDGTLNGTLAAHFEVGVLYKGSQITPYINGIALPTVTDTSYTSGWMALCTTGETTYTNALMYPLAS